MKTNLFLVAALLGVFALVPSRGLTRDVPAATRTEGGLVQGTIDGDVLAYKGIPYAQPPVGALRWRAPQPVRAWQGVRDGSRLAPDCMQAPFGPSPASGRHPVSEDCLYLNIWRPSSSAQKLPVMVWIHGGGFVNGGSSSLDATGERMAARGLVFVSFNYRLGRFGFFGLPALNAEHPGEASGNYGLMDQVAALKWVRRNIAQFGGDPAKVTLVGESAGGMSINYLMASPAARGLFARAIVMSGAGRKLPRERYLTRDLPDAASATTLGLAFARKHGIAGDDAKALAALRALSAEQVTDGLNMMTVLLMDKSLFGGPVIDGRIVVETPEATYAAGRQQKVPLIVGATTWDLGLNLAKTPDEAFAAFGPDADAARRAYDPDGQSRIEAINIAIGGDRTMVEPARFVARAMNAAGVSVYEYRFSYVLESMRAQSPFGAQHATDVAFAFDRLRAFHGAAVTPADERVSAAMADYWANFAHTGDPNGKGLPAWPVYRTSEDRLLDFGADGNIAAKPDPWRARLDLAERASNGPARAVAAGPKPADVLSLSDLPASFEGVLPCADCPGVRYHLDLFPDKLFFLRTAYEGTPRQSDTVGSWTVTADGTRLILARGRAAPLGFALENATTLRWLKREGTSFVGGTTYVLRRTSAFQPIEPRATLTGMYRHFADSGVFTPCGTRHRLPVAQEGENAKLEAAYGRVADVPRGDVLAELEGRIAMRPKMEGQGQQPTLIVERVGELSPGESCGAPPATVRLEDTYWKLTHLGDAPVILKERQPEPHLVLRGQDRRVGGNAGCNRMIGQYTLAGDTLEFGKIAATRMACLAGMDIEQKFLATLNRVKRWRLDGRHLELLDADGQRVARFEAGAPR